MSKERVLAKPGSNLSSSGRFKTDFDAIISDMSRSQDSKDRGKTWSYHETLELIKNWGDDEMQEQLSTTLRNYHVYGVIAKKMSAKGYWRTAEQCRCKIKGMKLMYRKCKDEDDSEKAQKMFTYYRLMDSIMSRRPVSPSMSHIQSETGSENQCETGLNQVETDFGNRRETSFAKRLESGFANRLESGFANQLEIGLDTPGTSRPKIEHVTNRETWSGACAKQEKDGVAPFSCGFDTPNHERDNSDNVYLIGGEDGCESLIEHGDSEPETNVLPLHVQIENSEEEEEDDIVMQQFANIKKTKRDASYREQSSVDSSSRKRKRLSKTIRQQEHLADRIIDKFLSNEERLIHLFLEAEERMMSRAEQMEERRMKFEQELAEKQQKEDTVRFERLFQLLSQSTAQQQQQQKAPPRVVYMQEVNPPNWAT